MLVLTVTAAGWAKLMADQNTSSYTKTALKHPSITCYIDKPRSVMPGNGTLVNNTALINKQKTGQ
jgi:hypothetical protein